MTIHSPSLFRRSVALVCAAAGVVLVQDARAAVSCVSALPGTTVIQPWKQAGADWSIGVNQAVNVAVVEFTYRFTKTGSTSEEVAFQTSWGNSGSTWRPAANAMGFFGGAQGYGLAVMLGNGQFGQPGVSAMSDPMILTRAGTYELTTKVYFSVMKVSDATTSGAFGMFGSSLHWSPRTRTNGAWTEVSGCAGTGAVSLSGIATGIGSPESAPKPAAVCTLNGGQAVSIRLPAVEATAMNGLGALPVGYRKQEYSLHYACTGTGGVVNPNYRIALVGTRAGMTDALQSSNPDVGVMVEAVDSKGAAPQVLIPGTTAGASQVRLQDAGRTGGATMTLLSYPVRSAGASWSDVETGPFEARGTLRVFTD